MKFFLNVINWCSRFFLHLFGDAVYVIVLMDERVLQMHSLDELWTSEMPNVKLYTLNEDFRLKMDFIFLLNDKAKKIVLFLF